MPLYSVKLEGGVGGRLWGCVVTAKNAQEALRRGTECYEASRKTSGLPPLAEITLRVVRQE